MKKQVPIQKPFRLSEKDRRRIMEAIGIKSCRDDADWSGLEKTIENYRICKKVRWYGREAQSRKRMTRLGQLAASVLGELEKLTPKEAYVLFGDETLGPLHYRTDDWAKMFQCAQDDRRDLIVQCRIMIRSARKGADYFDFTKHPHNVELIKYETWILAGKFFYEPVSGRKMGTSWGAIGSEHEGQVVGPFVRFIQALMTIVDHSKPTGQEVRDFIRHVQSDVKRGKPGLVADANACRKEMNEYQGASRKI